MKRTSVLILMADDDPDDCMLAQRAFEESEAGGSLVCVPDGVELLDYLSGQGRYEGRPPPALVLLDLNMPRKDGRQALKEIREDPDLKDTRIIIFTTSSEAKDIELSRRLGADGFITKPSMFEDWVKIMKSLAEKVPPAD